MRDLLQRAGIQSRQHLMVHSSYRKIRNAYPSLSIDELLSILKELVTAEGSLIMPAFTYNWKPVIGTAEAFDRQKTPCRTGAVAEVFRSSTGVVRTSSPTHSFALWGKVNDYISSTDSPSSPLGYGSACDWLANTDNSFLLLLGTDFSALSFCHYLEILFSVPWYGYSPWKHLNISEAGLSTDGEQRLKEIPGCSKSFVNFEKHLLNLNLLYPVFNNSLRVILIPVSLLITAGEKFFTGNYMDLLCPEGTCRPCGNRRNYYYYCQLRNNEL